MRVLHPTLGVEKVFAIEPQSSAFFPLQDFRSNLCALQKADGSLAEWTRYSAFVVTIPWHFTSKREIEGLVLFTHRLYHPQLMRWLTPDPADFIDGLNLYAYVHNNPFYYEDRDGLFVFVLALPVVIEFGITGIALSAPIVDVIVGTALD